MGCSPVSHGKPAEARGGLRGQGHREGLRKRQPLGGGGWKTAVRSPGPGVAQGTLSQPGPAPPGRPGVSELTGEQAPSEVPGTRSLGADPTGRSRRRPAWPQHWGAAGLSCCGRPGRGGAQCLQHPHTRPTPGLWCSAPLAHTARRGNQGTPSHRRETGPWGGTEPGFALRLGSLLSVQRPPCLGPGETEADG